MMKRIMLRRAGGWSCVLATLVSCSSFEPVRSVELRPGAASELRSLTDTMLVVVATLCGDLDDADDFEIPVLLDSGAQRSVVSAETALRLSPWRSPSELTASRLDVSVRIGRLEIGGLAAAGFDSLVLGRSPAWELAPDDGEARSCGMIIGADVLSRCVLGAKLDDRLIVIADSVAAAKSALGAVAEWSPIALEPADWRRGRPFIRLPAA